MWHLQYYHTDYNSNKQQKSLVKAARLYSLGLFSDKNFSALEADGLQKGCVYVYSMSPCKIVSKYFESVQKQWVLLCACGRNKFSEVDNHWKSVQDKGPIESVSHQRMWLTVSKNNFQNFTHRKGDFYHQATLCVCVCKWVAVSLVHLNCC